MIVLPKKIAFLIFLLVTFLLGTSFSEVNWNVLQSNEIQTIYEELREALVFLVLAIYFTKYYVDILKKEKGSD